LTLPDLSVIDPGEQESVNKYSYAAAPTYFPHGPQHGEKTRGKLKGLHNTMSALNSKVIWKSFLGRFIFPTAVTILLFVVSFFSIIIPSIEKNSMDRKREMIRELTNSAWNILAKLENDERKGLLTREQAQRQAIEQIGSLHYGQEMKDYFWINDMHPRMIIHPYRTDLNGKDLTNYKDPDGKQVFVEFVKLVKKDGAGYMTYRWQWKDNEERILPKISYVKGFTPWGWIIGTGIYIDDVKAEIGSIIRNLIEISLFILLVITLMLSIIIKQSYAALRHQQAMEKALRESEIKYRTLVESAAEGMLMAIEGKFRYANQTIADYLEYTQDEFSLMRVTDIFPDEQNNQSHQYAEELAAGKSVPERFETRLKTKSGTLRDVILAATPISIGEENGFMAVVTDITKRKQTEDALGESEEKFRTIANNLNVGVFRRTIGNNSQFIEINAAFVKLFGYEDREEILAITIADLLVNTSDKKIFRSKASADNLKPIILKMKKKDGSIFTASVWEAVVRDEEGKREYFDGIIEDITEAVEKEKGHEKLLAEMQTALMFFNRQLGNLSTGRVVVCAPEATVKEAVQLMESEHTDILLVKNDRKQNLGVITDHDLRKALMNTGLNEQAAVASIMSSPIHSLPVQSTIFESWLTMQQNKISHLFISDSEGVICGVIHSEDVVPLRTYSPAILLWEIQNSKSPEEIINRNTILPYLIVSLIDSGAKPQHINHLTTVIVDAILQKFIEFAIKESGEPPAKFCFLVFGSEGRREQTLRTDQDNAIIYDDVSPDQEKAVHEYFLALGKRVCYWLNEAGYAYCEGDNMAQNPQWCRSLSQWKKYFHQWVFKAEAEDLLRTKIFFDFRCGYGEGNFTRQLREYLDEIVADNNRFFQLLARNVLPLSPPIGFFGNFVIESVGEDKKAFDIKSSMMPIVDYARIYALKNKIWATNTLERLNALLDRNILKHQNHQEIVQAYNYLMQIRLRVQAEEISHGRKNPDNYVNPKNLSFIEQKLLKEIFAQTKNFQARLSYDFTGQLGGV